MENFKIKERKKYHRNALFCKKKRPVWVFFRKVGLAGFILCKQRALRL